MLNHFLFFLGCRLLALAIRFDGARFCHQAKADLPNAVGRFSTTVPYHDGVLLVFMPVGSAWPLPFELAAWMRIPPPPVPPTLA